MVDPTPLYPQSRFVEGAPRAPQAPVEKALEAPEVLVINALLEGGAFTPEAYGLTSEMLATAHKPWAFCVEHQQQVGRAPTLDLFSRSFPDFDLVSGVSPQWAADKLRTAHWERSMRRTLQGAIAAINEKEWDTAHELVREAARPALKARPKGMTARDVASVDEAAVKISMPVPYYPLQKETKGLGFGEFWLKGARLGQGKSWFLPLYAVCAAEYGMSVGVMTAEMPKRQWIRRIHMMAAVSDEHRKRLQDPNVDVRTAALDELPPWLDNIEVLDPSDLEMGIRGTRLLAQERQLLVLDHVGLWRDHNGKRSIDDWRVAASISNDLKEIALQNNVGVLAGIQINREGEGAGHKPPKPGQLAQSDAYGQDADVIVTMKRMGVRAMLHDCNKNRSGENVRFYTKFEPKTGCFKEISKDEALAIQIEDAERLGDI